MFLPLAHSRLELLVELEDELEKEGLPGGGQLTSPVKTCIEEGSRVRVLYFFTLIVIPLLDANKDDQVDREELLAFQVSLSLFGVEQMALCRCFLSFLCSCNCLLHIIYEKVFLCTYTLKVLCDIIKQCDDATYCASVIWCIVWHQTM